MDSNQTVKLTTGFKNLSIKDNMNSMRTYSAVCKYYKSGTCKLGDQCRFSHGQKGDDKAYNHNHNNGNNNNTGKGGQDEEKPDEANNPVLKANIPNKSKRRPFMQIVVLFGADPRVIRYSKEVQSTFLENGIDVYLQTEDSGQQNLADIITNSKADCLIVLGDRNMKNRSCQAKRRGKLVETDVDEMIKAIWNEWSHSPEQDEEVEIDVNRLNEDHVYNLLEKHSNLRHVKDRFSRLRVAVDELKDVKLPKSRGHLEGGSVHASDLANKLTQSQKMTIRLHEQLAESLEALENIPTSSSNSNNQAKHGVACGPDYNPADLKLGIPDTLKDKLISEVRRLIPKVEGYGSQMSELGSPLWDAYRNEYNRMKKIESVIKGATAKVQPAENSGTETKSSKNGATPKNSGQWNCFVCTFLNEGSSQKCVMCENPRSKNPKTDDEWNLTGEAGKKQRKKMKAKQEAAKREQDEDTSRKLRELEERKKVELQKEELKRLAEAKAKEEQERQQALRQQQLQLQQQLQQEKINQAHAKQHVTHPPSSDYWQSSPRAPPQQSEPSVSKYSAPLLPTNVNNTSSISYPSIPVQQTYNKPQDSRHQQLFEQNFPPLGGGATSPEPSLASSSQGARKSSQLQQQPQPQQPAQQQPTIQQSHAPVHLQQPQQHQQHSQQSQHQSQPQIQQQPSQLQQQQQQLQQPYFSMQQAPSHSHQHSQQPYHPQTPSQMFQQQSTQQLQHTQHYQTPQQTFQQPQQSYQQSQQQQQAYQQQYQQQHLQYQQAVHAQQQSLQNGLQSNQQPQPSQSQAQQSQQTFVAAPKLPKYTTPAQQQPAITPPVAVSSSASSQQQYRPFAQQQDFDIMSGLWQMGHSPVQSSEGSFQSWMNAFRPGTLFPGFETPQQQQNQPQSQTPQPSSFFGAVQTSSLSSSPYFQHFAGQSANSTSSSSIQSTTPPPSSLPVNGGMMEEQFDKDRAKVRESVLEKYKASTRQPQRPCCYCGEESVLECNLCAKTGFATYFCSVEHQTLMWKEHVRVHQNFIASMNK